MHVELNLKMFALRHDVMGRFSENEQKEEARKKKTRLVNLKTFFSNRKRKKNFNFRLKEIVFKLFPIQNSASVDSNAMDNWVETNSNTQYEANKEKN